VTQLPPRAPALYLCNAAACLSWPLSALSTWAGGQVLSWRLALVLCASIPVLLLGMVTFARLVARGKAKIEVSYNQAGAGFCRSQGRGV
jgi:hypothetical protein